jgi:hypothetical protein
MTTAKHSHGCLNRDGVPSVANIDATEPHTASASINWQTESAFGANRKTGYCFELYRF